MATSRHVTVTATSPLYLIGTMFFFFSQLVMSSSSTINIAGVSYTTSPHSNPSFSSHIFVLTPTDTLPLSPGQQRPKDPKVMCRTCQHHFAGSHTRIVNHITSGSGIKGCPNPPISLFNSLVPPEKRKPDPDYQDLRNIYPTEYQERCESAQERFFFGCGIPFNLSRNPHFLEFCHELSGGKFTPISYDQLRNESLDKVKNEITKETNEILEVQPSFTIVSDGWSNINSQKIVDTVLVSPQGAYFVDSTDVSDTSQTSEFISEYISNAIEIHGKSKVMNIVTDSVRANETARKLFQRTDLGRTVDWSFCVAHCLDLFLEDLQKSVIAFKNTLDAVRKIVSFVNNHSRVLSIFRKISTLEPLEPATTRFGTNIIMAQRLQSCKDQIKQLKVSDEFLEWKRGQNSGVKRRCEETEIFVLNQRFWDSLGDVLKIGLPVLNLIDFVNGDSEVISEVYPKSKAIYDQLEVMEMGSLNPHKEQIKCMFDTRWKRYSSNLHLACYALDPRNLILNQDFPQTVIDGFYHVLQMYLSKTQQMDAWLEFQEYKSLTALPPNSLQYLSVSQIGKKTTLALWWHSMASLPTLSSLARKLVSLVVVSSASERSWSTFGFIHSKARNRLTHRRASDLVFVHSNLRLLKKSKDKNFRPKYLVAGNCELEY
ncbi:hypothetical protein RCL1_001772 [Eukaryota sp. TZLM3-RCL]